MKVFYDFHIHSCLSPCADNENTPVNVVAMAQVKQLNMIAVCDHNAIENVPFALEAGEALGVTVIPGMEYQTAEDIHIVILFKTFEKLNAFYSLLTFQPFLNEKEIFGEQLIVDTDDQVVGEIDRMLLSSGTLSVNEAVKMVNDAGGITILAHIDRESNGVVAILGDVPEELEADALEFSHTASELLKERYSGRNRIVTDSDAHTLADISDARYFLELTAPTIDALFNYFGK